MTSSSPTSLLAARTVVQIPRNPLVLVFSLAPVLLFFLIFGSLFKSLTRLPGFPTDNYHEYLAPAIVLMSALVGIANAATGLAVDFQSRYFYKLMTSRASVGSIMFGRLLGDSVRLFGQGALMLLLATLFGARVRTGPAGALLMLVLASLFGVVTLGLLTANAALKSKDPSVVQSLLPVAFVLTFLTTSFQTKGQIDSAFLRRVIDMNPTEHILRPMRELMLTGYDWQSIGAAFAVIGAIAAVGLPLTIANFRSVYR